MRPLDPRGPPPPAARPPCPGRWSSAPASSGGWPPWPRRSRSARSWSRRSPRRPAAGTACRVGSRCSCCCGRCGVRRPAGGGPRGGRGLRSAAAAGCSTPRAAADDLSPDPPRSCWPPAASPASSPTSPATSRRWCRRASCRSSRWPRSPGSTRCPGLVVALTLPLVPVFAVLVGHRRPATGPARQWRALEALSGHFLDVVRGLPTLVAHRRAEAQVGTIRRGHAPLPPRHRRHAQGRLRLVVGARAGRHPVRRAGGGDGGPAAGRRGRVDFQVALTVLLLAPEAYWPLRRVGAEFHAAAEGTAALADARRRSWRGPRPVEPGTALPRLASGLALRGLEIGVRARRRPDPSARPRPSRPGPGRRSPGRPAAASRRCWPPCAASWRRCPATSGSAATPSPTSTRAGGARQVGVGTAATVARWPTPSRANVRIGRPGRGDDEVWEALDRVGLGRRRARPPPTAWTRRSARTAPACRPASGPASRWPASCSPRARSCSSTSRAPTSTRRPSRSCSRPSRRSLAQRSLVVVVAHRPAVLAAADRVVELVAGDRRRWRHTTRRSAGADDVVAALSARPAPVAGRSRPTTTSAAPRWGMRTAHPARRAVHRLRRRAHRDRRLAHHPCQRAAAGALPDGRHRRRAPLRPGPPGAAPRRARCVSHDVVLRELAERRARVYADLVPLVPGRLGPRRGDLLTSVVDDVDALLDDRLRVRQPAGRPRRSSASAPPC